MDFPASGGPTKIVRVTATGTEPCFLRDSWYDDCHSTKARRRGLCNEECYEGECCLVPCQVKCEQESLPTTTYVHGMVPGVESTCYKVSL